MEAAQPLPDQNLKPTIDPRVVASDSTAITGVQTQALQRQNSTSQKASSTLNKASSSTKPAPVKPRNINHRGLTLPTSLSPSISASSTATVQPHQQYQSLGEGATHLASQRHLLSPTPPLLPISRTASTPLVPLQQAPSRPGTPSYLARPGTPSLRAQSKTPIPSTPNTALSPLPSASTITSPSAKATNKGKLKAQLTDLLPRHTYFHARIEIEQLASVPFVRGEFGVRWKFKNLHRNVGGNIGGVSNGTPRHSPRTEDIPIHSQGTDGENSSSVGKSFFGMMKTARSNKGKAKETLDDPANQHVNEFGSNSRTESSPSLSSHSTGPHQYMHPHKNSDNSSSSYSSGDSYSTSSVSAGSIPTHSSSSATSIYSNTTAATKTGTSTPSGNLSRTFSSPSNGSATPNNTLSALGQNQYLFAAGDPSSQAQSPNEHSLLFSPNQHSFSSNAAVGGLSSLMSPLSPASVISPTGTITQANAGSHPHGASGSNLLSPVPNGPSSHSAPSIGGVGIGHTPARGFTPYIALKDHSIAFNHSLSAILRFDIARGTAAAKGGKSNLQPNEFKLVVMQRVIPDDPDGVPQNPRLGAVYLNLAEYVDKGRVERRYLLKDSRVNATLKLNIEVTYVSGYVDYIAPPLPKAEIMGGIEGFLTQNEDLLYNKRVKDIYGFDSYQDSQGRDELQEMIEKETDILSDEEVLMGGSAWDVVQGTKRKEKKDPYALPTDSEAESESEPGASKRGAAKSSRKKTFHLDQENPYALPPSESESEDSVFEDAEDDFDDGFTEESSPSSHVHGYTAESRKPSARNLDQQGRRQQQASHASEGKEMAIAAFDVQRLPLAYGPRTTEALIEALFNPVVISNKKQETPFTVYVEPSHFFECGGMPRRRVSQSTRTSMSESATTRESSSPGTDDLRLVPVKSPGEDTIVGVPHLESVTGPIPIGLGIDGIGQGDKDATIGRRQGEKHGGVGVGTLLHNYYKNRKGKREKKQKKDTTLTMDSTVTAGTTIDSTVDGGARTETSGSLLGGAVYHEPLEMRRGTSQGSENAVGPARPSGVYPGHRRSATNGTLASTSTSYSVADAASISSSSLSSLSLGSGSRSGHSNAHPPPPPPPIPDFSIAAESSAPIPVPLPMPAGTSPLLRQNSAKGKDHAADLSVPDGRMDRMGVVKGQNLQTQSAVLTGSTHSFAKDLKGWWRGFGNHR